MIGLTRPKLNIKVLGTVVVQNLYAHSAVVSFFACQRIRATDILNPCKAK